MADAFKSILVASLAFAFLPERPTRSQGGTDGSNPLSSSEESCELRYGRRRPADQDDQGARSRQYLFPSRFRERPHISTRQYARIVHGWVAGAGLDSSAYGTHSMRRTKPAQIYKKTGNLRAVQLLLGHTKLESTVRYLGIEVGTRSASQSRLSCEPMKSCGLASSAGPRPDKSLSRANWLNPVEVLATSHCSKAGPSRSTEPVSRGISSRATFRC